MNVAIITAIYDSYDPLKEIPAQDVRGEAICITDNPELASKSWDVRCVPSALPSVRAAKVPKVCPWDFTDAEVVIWVDGSIRINRWDFISDIVTFAEPIGQFVHPWRDCIYDEASYSLEWCPKYQDEPLWEQTTRYREWGHPEHWGLWAAGVIVQRRCDQTLELGQRWLAEIEGGSFQDQVSQPAVLRKVGLRPATIPGSYQSGRNPWLEYEGSPRH